MCQPPLLAGLANGIEFPSVFTKRTVYVVVVFKASDAAIAFPLLHMQWLCSHRPSEMLNELL